MTCCPTDAAVVCMAQCWSRLCVKMCCYCCCCCSLSAKRTRQVRASCIVHPDHNVCTPLQHTVCRKHLHRALHALYLKPHTPPALAQLSIRTAFLKGPGQANFRYCSSRKRVAGLAEESCAAFQSFQGSTT